MTPPLRPESSRPRLLWIGADLAVTDVAVRSALSVVEMLAESSLAGGLRHLKAAAFDVIVISLASLTNSPARALEDLFGIAPDVPVIVHHREGSIDDVIQLTRRGAFYVIVGEVEPGILAEAVAKALRTARSKVSPSVDSLPWRRFLVGRSRPMLQVCEIIQLVAVKRCTILISGETGTGKEVIAKAIHAASNRASQQLVSVNCTALPATLIETELFGHAKGAFTGAIGSRIGRFEQAHRGSLFLDEIGDLPLEAQAKLLRVLQEQEFQRVGSSETVRVDVRVIAASNVDLEQAVRERRFREDLYYRLNVVPIQLPPLRDRSEDIPLLLRHFAEKIRATENGESKQISEEAIEYLQQLEWPGNVRQLEHALQMAFALSGERRMLGPNDFRSRQGPRWERATPIKSHLVQLPQEGLDFDAVVGTFELSLLNQALTASGGNKARAADLLKIKRTTLLAKIKSLGQAMQPPAEYREKPANMSDARPEKSEEIPEKSSASIAILLEHEPAIRKLLAGMLRREGFRVLNAASADEALELLECWKRQSSLLVTSFAAHNSSATAQPATSELTIRARQIIPNLPVILLAENCEAIVPPAEPSTYILARPFDSDEVGALLNSVKGRALTEVPHEVSA